MEELGQLQPEEMYETLDLVGKNAGLREIFGNPKVSARVKAAMSNLMLCMSNVVGSNAHRTTLRHINTSYNFLFGPPLVFTTPNVADTRNPLMNVFYQNQFLKSWPLFNDANESDTWRELEKHAPSMPSRSDMLRRVARDPVGQAMVFDVMVKLFLEHVLGCLLYNLTLPTKRIV